jgi:hypothetical protein
MIIKKQHPIINDDVEMGKPIFSTFNKVKSKSTNNSIYILNKLQIEKVIGKINLCIQNLKFDNG